ncbi:MAG: cysteine desulfurase [Oscillospiraceae bacterium]|nr:cysteine desulfurase [Oscillospiraceae bacterium]
MIYFDNAATTLPSSEVIEEMAKTLRDFPGNPSSLHELGRAAAKKLDACREIVARALGSESQSLTFTSGGTESVNWAICGALHAMRHRGRHIIAGAIEHDAVLAPLKALSDRGYEITLLPPDSTGLISPLALADALRDDTALVSVMLANNETGAIQPIRELADFTHTHSPALFHTDAIQGLCKLNFTAETLGADLISISAHKLHGPKGVGGLWIRPGLHVSPLIRGGGQERNLRSGTEALHNIAGFAKAVELATASFKETSTQLQALQTHLRTTLPQRIPNAHFLPLGAPHIVSVSLPDTKSEVIMNYLDSQNIAVSHASACKRGERSHVLTAMGLSNEIIDGTIRVSFSKYNTVQEVDLLIQGLTDAKDMLFPAPRGGAL